MNDSRIDTYTHIALVQTLMETCISELLKRQLYHDKTKLESPEKEAYDELGERLRTQEYASEGYKAALREMKPAIKHHYELNSHHPEHYDNQIAGMNLVDLIEMTCDWMAASKRPPGNDVRKAMDNNQARYDLSPQLRSIIENTFDLIEGAHT